MSIAVIPARGGSKRVPRKNLRDFCGRPMLAWPIEAARQSGLFRGIFVSTDDPAIAEAATRAGAEVPFLRPAELADDHAGTGLVVEHAVRWLMERQQVGADEPVCCLYATAAFVDPRDLRRGEETVRGTRQGFALAVAAFASPVQRALIVAPDGRLAMLHPEHQFSRSQDLEPAFHDAGQFCWGAAEAWLAGPPTARSCLPVVIPAHRVVDIDTPEDWLRAEMMFRASLESGTNDWNAARTP